MHANVALTHTLKNQWAEYLKANPDYEFDSIEEILGDATELVPVPVYVRDGCQAFKHDDVPAKLFLGKKINGESDTILFTTMIAERAVGSVLAEKPKATLEELIQQNTDAIKLLKKALEAIAGCGNRKADKSPNQGFRFG